MEWNDGRLLLPNGAVLEVAPRGPGAEAHWKDGALELRRGRSTSPTSGDADGTIELAVTHSLRSPTHLWVPHLTPAPHNVAGDWVFRCPATIVADAGLALALVVDVDDVRRASGWRAWLDYDHPRSTVTLGAGAYRHDGHVFFVREPARLEQDTRISLRLHVLASTRAEDLENPYGFAARWCWRRWGRPGLQRAAPVPAARHMERIVRWAFSSEGWGDSVWQDVRTGGVSAGAPVFIVDVGRHPSVPRERRTWREPRSIWNQAWFSTQRCANGLLRYGRQVGSAELDLRARQMTVIALAAPQTDGLFPSVLQADDAGGWRWTSSDRRPPAVTEQACHLVDAAVTCRSLLEWHELTGDGAARAYVERFARRLVALQRSSGAFPGWVEPDGRVPPELAEGPESAVSVALLLGLEGASWRDAALRGVEYLRAVAAEGRWEDFETYYSCARWGAPEQLGRRVARNGVFKQNTLSIAWCAEAFLLAWRATGDRALLRLARRCLDELSLYQAVWDPPFLPAPAHGGFGVMNADSEWNDARQSLFAPLYLELGHETGDAELVERGVSALRASFSMLYCPENESLARAYEARFPFFGPESYGFMMENQGHDPAQPIGTFTIYTWGNGSALAAVATVRDRFPDVAREHGFSMIRELCTTPDAYVGLDDPTAGEWEDWHRAMLAEREHVLAGAGFDAGAYEDSAAAWSDRTFRQLFLFLYDTSVYDGAAGRYRTPEMVEEWRARFGRVDEVLLWHAYPRLGFDTRTQFDFYRQLPGGLGGLRRDVCDVLHAAGMRVFVDYNPWDEGTFDELAEIVHALDADGVMLDTMTDVPDALHRAVNARRRGVVFAPELRLRPGELRHARQSWAQWFDVGDASTPSVYRSRWLVPRHRQFAIARWDRSRRRDIVYSFFNGSGLVLWENVFGAYNPYSREDRRLVAETAAVLDAYEDLFARGEWLPLVPTGVPGLDANRFTDASTGRAIVTLRNRTAARLSFTVPDGAPPGMAHLAFWGDSHEVSPGDRVEVEPGGTQAVVVDEPARTRAALARFEAWSRRAGAEMPGDAEPRPLPRPRPAPTLDLARADAATDADARMVALRGGDFTMRLRHDRRECGCYALGATDDATWGWDYRDTIVHEMRAVVQPFAIRATAVTNAEFVAFVRESGYQPADGERFLAHIPRDAHGALPASLSDAQAALPVTHVSLGDARAFAAFRGQRLPSEIEWQWAAEGAGAGRRFPWGNDERRFESVLRPAADEALATPEGVMGLSGNAWELTESEHTDGHTRFVMLRGGVFLPPGGSEWLVTRGPRPNDSHAKYLLLADCLDRSSAVSFRTCRTQ